MGICFKRGKIRSCSLILYGSSFLREILKDYRYAFDEGLVLVADNETSARRFVTAYCDNTEGNGCKVASWNRRSKKPENYCCALMSLKKMSKEEEVENFLEEQEFLPVVVAGGLLPEYLRLDRNIFRLTKEDIEDVSRWGFRKEIKEFCNYIISNVSDVCITLREVNDCIPMQDYKEIAKAYPIFKTCLAIGLIYAKHLRRFQAERQVSNFLTKYVDDIKNYLGQMAEFASGEELPEMLSSLAWEAISSDEKIKVVDITLVNGTAYTSLKEKSAILFDDKFYYFPPDLFMKICGPLLQTASTTQLKQRLREYGIIHCNSADYTVKKEITSVYGVKETQRFIWVYKEYLLSEDNLRLEDVFGHVINEEEE